MIEGAAKVRAMLCEYGYGEAESILDEWNLMYKWGPRVNQAPAYPAMKDHRGAACYAGVLCGLQEQSDVAAGAYFEADVVKEFCGIFDVDGMCIGGLTKGEEYFATVKPTKGFYAFKRFNTLYRLGEQVALSCDEDRLYATAAAGVDGVGTMIANVGMLYGYRVHGLLGGLVCLVGMCLPPMLVMLVISFFYSVFRDNYWVNAAMLGMQAAVVPIIASAARNMIKGSAPYPPCVFVIAASTALYLFTPINPVLLVLMGVVCGLLIGGYYERKEAGKHGSA
jgi:chromate transporter